MSRNCLCNLCGVPVDCGEHVCPACEVEICKTEEELKKERDACCPSVV